MSCASACSMPSNTPLLLHSWNRSWQVVFGGYLSGISSQFAPVRSTQRIPFSTGRSGMRFRPRLSLRTRTGMSGSSTAHCSSVMSFAMFVFDLSWRPDGRLTGQLLASTFGWVLVHGLRFIRARQSSYCVTLSVYPLCYLMIPLVLRCLCVRADIYPGDERCNNERKNSYGVPENPMIEPCYTYSSHLKQPHSGKNNDRQRKGCVVLAIDARDKPDKFHHGSTSSGHPYYNGRHQRQTQIRCACWGQQPPPCMQE